MIRYWTKRFSNDILTENVELEDELKEIWKEILKLEGKDVEKSMKIDKKKKAKKRLKPTVNNIIKWMINPAKYDLVCVDG